MSVSPTSRNKTWGRGRVIGSESSASRRKPRTCYKPEQRPKQNAAKDAFRCQTISPHLTSIVRTGSPGRSIAIFTFTLTFLYPRFASGDINGLLFEAALAVMGVATFSFVFATLYYYGSSLGSRMDDAERALYSRRGARFWLLGYTLLFLDPSLILAAVGLLVVGSVWLALWLVYILFAIRYFPRVQTARKIP